MFHGDNLRFLRGMNSETIDLIATDPPFNKGRDFHATPDSLASGAKFQDRWSWANDVEQAWMDEIEDSEPGVAWTIEAARETYGEDMAAFLCFMGVRLLEMKRVLAPTGSIYLHCDPTASHYLKALMDAIFGRDQFRNEIVWSYRKMPNNAKHFQRNHDTLLFYSKGDHTFNRQYEDYSESSKRTYERVQKVGYNANLKKRMVTVFDWDKYNQAVTAGDLPGDLQPSEFKGTGVPMRAVWDLPILAPSAKERTGYPTQKPLALYERIIRASSNTGDVVLDPFAGCATTPIAAERLGRQWLAMDIWDGAYKMISDRLAGLGLLAADDERRGQRLTAVGEVHRETEPPVRTDGGEVAAPYLQVTERYDIPADGSPRTRAGMLEHLLARYGPRCQGCDREFDDPRYLQLDHNTPHKDGGINHISNRVLLCGPCNREKGARYTLTGLRERNAKMGYMAKGATR